MRGKFLPALMAVAFAGCLGAPSTPPGSGGTTGSASGGSDGSGSGGSSSSGGTTGEGSGGTIGTASGGTTGTASGGTTGTASGGTTGTASGGATGSGGVEETGSGGTTATGSGGMMMSGSGGVMDGGGRMGMASGGTQGGGGRMGTGSGGMMMGSGGTMGSGGSTGTDPWAALDGLRFDDACGTILSGNVCLHADKPSDNGTPFMGSKSATMGGTVGTTYQVKLRIRGIVEPTNISGGTVGTPSTFVTGGNRGADGSNAATYQQWRITTSVPNQHYYLNAISGGLSHVVMVLDEMQTIPIGGGATVTIDVYDGNAHEIANNANPPKTIADIPGSKNSGQFVQINVLGGM